MADELRGVIDRFEGDLAAIVFDDGQRLNLPRGVLASGARAGDAVVVRIAAGAFRGVWRDGRIVLDDGQSLRWPGRYERHEVGLSVEIDPEDTAARKRRVGGLLDDVFGPPRSS